MVTIRQVAACVVNSPFSAPGAKLSGTLSVKRRLLGYVAPKFSWSGVIDRGRVSLRDHIGLLRGPHLHLNLIRVGSDNFTDKHAETIDKALYKMRGIYARVGIGIGRVIHPLILISEAMGHDIIDEHCEAHELVDEWLTDNDGHDVFLVLSSWLDDGLIVRGVSDVSNDGCDKHGKDDMSGSVVSLTGIVGFVMAHEVGHFLGLEHCDDDPASCAEKPNNVMSPGDQGNPGWEGLTASQATKMKSHCLIRPGINC